MIPPNNSFSKYLFLQKVVFPNICFFKYLFPQSSVSPSIFQISVSQNIFLSPNIHFSKYYFLQTFISPNICFPKYLFLQVIISPKYLFLKKILWVYSYMYISTIQTRAFSWDCNVLRLMQSTFIADAFAFSGNILPTHHWQ